MPAKFMDVLGTVVVVAGLLVMTRPGSQGPGLVNAFMGGFSHIVSSADGTSYTSVP